jgi:protein AATF/BFR2
VESSLTQRPDFDPESLLDPAPSSSSDEHSDADLSDVEDPNAGREHYTAVGKSKLRQAVDAPSGPAYKGKAISRDDLEDSDSDDPFAKGFDEEDSEDEDDVEGVSGLSLGGEDERKD